ncbi:MAG: glycine betaine/L-proline ABC transporter substrate-binding protein ProX [Gammaproteobacteria bacterium]
MRPIHFIRHVVVLFAAILCASTGLADNTPGKGISVQPGQDNIDGENFQTIIVIKALEELGYDVRPVQHAKYPALHVAVGNGDISFIADHWNPLHKAFFEKAGGNAKLSRQGSYIPNCAQGYLIDRRTAEKHGITNISQLQDPAVAKLFDDDGDGKADLAGCPPGWGCERVIEHHLDTYDLRNTVQHNQGEYSAVIADTISRYRDGSPILYYTWTPYWVSGVLVPGKDVVWIEVPFSSLPDDRNVDTTLPNGKNYGFEINRQNIVANRQFVDANPAAARLFEVMQISPDHVSAQNLKMREPGEGTWEACEHHAEAWIKANRDTFDSWLEQARAAAASR